MGNDGGKLEVFISYSRRDSTVFADQLDKALQTFGFKTVLDRHQISGGEDWQKRLGALILSADTVVFILSPMSAVSEICLWEIEEAQRLHKRILPVVAQPLGAAKAPSTLQKLNYMHFYDEPSVPGSGFGDGIAKLVTALNSDLDWLREHSRLLGLAERWEQGGRNVDRLLTGTEIAEARQWLKDHPATAPEPTALQLELIAASEARASEEADKRRAELALREDLAKKAEAAARDQQDAARKAEAEAKRAEDALAAVKTEQQRTAKSQRRLSWALGAGAIAVVFGLYAAWWMQYHTILREAVVLTSVAQKAIDEQHYDRAMRIALQGLPHPGSGWLTPGWDAEQIHGLETKLIGAAQGSRFRSLVRHKDDVVELAFSPTQHKAVTASWDGTAKVLNTRTGEILFEISHGEDINSVEFSPDGGRIITTSDDRKGRIWSSENGQQLVELSGHSGRVFSGIFSLDGKLVATSSADGSAIVYDAERGKQIARFSHNAPVFSVSFYPDGLNVITASDDSTARVWEIATQRELFALKHDSSVWTAKITGDAIWIVTASADGSSAVWSAATGERQHRLEHALDVNYVMLSNDGTKAVTASDDNTAVVWDIAKGSKIARLQHAAGVQYADFNSDGSLVVSASSDGTVRLWTLGERELARLSGHEGVVKVALINPNGSLVLSGGEDGTVRLWNIEQQRSSLRGESLRVQVCAEKLTGAQEFTEADATDPILSGLAGRNPCLARGPLSTSYWSGFSGWMSRQIARIRGAAEK